MLVPVMTRLDDLRFDLFLDYTESLKTLRSGWVRIVEVDDLGGSCANKLTMCMLRQ